MKTGQARLVEPAEELREAYLDFVAECAAAGEADIHGSGTNLRPGEDFAGLVRRLRDASRGIPVKPGYVPATTYWLVRDGQVIGTANLRHRLTPALEAFGGHIGYAIRPSRRGQGYGSLQLRLVLNEARRMGLARVLLTCDKDNIASARAIQKCGGVLDSEGVDPADGKLTQRYWIDLRPDGVRDDTVSFVELDESMREAFIDYCREFQSAGEPFRGHDLQRAEEDWPAFIRQQRDGAAGRNLPDGVVPGVEFCLVKDGAILGACRIRLRLTEALSVVGGHIGYDVRPSQRRKGHATLMLRLGLERLRREGLTRVLVTCEKDNLASATVIRKCGGILENEVISPRSGKWALRFWIDLAAKEGGT